MANYIFFSGWVTMVSLKKNSIKNKNNNYYFNCTYLYLQIYLKKLIITTILYHSQHCVIWFGRVVDNPFSRSSRQTIQMITIQLIINNKLCLGSSKKIVKPTSIKTRIL